MCSDCDGVARRARDSCEQDLCSLGRSWSTMMISLGALFVLKNDFVPLFNLFISSFLLHIYHLSSHSMPQVHQSLHPHAPLLLQLAVHHPPHTRLLFPSFSADVCMRCCLGHSGSLLVNRLRAASACDQNILCSWWSICCDWNCASGAGSALFRQVLWTIGAAESLPYSSHSAHDIRCTKALANTARNCSAQETVK